LNEPNSHSIFAVDIIII